MATSAAGGRQGAGVRSYGALRMCVAVRPSTCVNVGRGVAVLTSDVPFPVVVASHHIPRHPGNVVVRPVHVRPAKARSGERMRQGDMFLAAARPVVEFTSIEAHHVSWNRDCAPLPSAGPSGAGTQRTWSRVQ